MGDSEEGGWIWKNGQFLFGFWIIQHALHLVPLCSTILQNCICNVQWTNPYFHPHNQHPVTPHVFCLTFLHSPSPLGSNRKFTIPQLEAFEAVADLNVTLTSCPHPVLHFRVMSLVSCTVVVTVTTATSNATSTTAVVDDGNDYDCLIL